MIKPTQSSHSCFASSAFIKPLCLGVIKSVDEYATILGKKVTELTETKFQPPEVSESEVNTL